jgi:hypothetical protein
MFRAATIPLNGALTILNAFERFKLIHVRLVRHDRCLVLAIGVSRCTRILYSNNLPVVKVPGACQLCVTTARLFVSRSYAYKFREPRTNFRTDDFWFGFADRPEKRRSTRGQNTSWKPMLCYAVAWPVWVHGDSSKAQKGWF